MISHSSTHVTGATRSSTQQLNTRKTEISQKAKESESKPQRPKKPVWFKMGKQYRFLFILNDMILAIAVTNIHNNTDCDQDWNIINSILGDKYFEVAVCVLK